MFGLFARFISLLHPLLLFLIVGALLFTLDSWHKSQSSEERNIQISSGRIEQFEIALFQRYGRLPTDIELDAELQAYIEEEILYREALSLGLHKTDEVVRRRLAQSMAFIIEGKADIDNPSESELLSWYEQTRPEFRALTRFDFRHVFFSFDRSKGYTEDQVQFEISETLKKLDLGELTAGNTGDPFLLGTQFRGYSLAKITSTFGQSFAKAITEIEPEQWSGVLTSNYGYHLVLIEDREQVTSSDIEQQRDQLINAWRTQRRREVLRQELDQLRTKFNLEFETDIDRQRDQKADQR